MVGEICFWNVVQFFLFFFRVPFFLRTHAWKTDSKYNLEKVTLTKWTYDILQANIFDLISPQILTVYVPLPSSLSYLFIFFFHSVLQIWKAGNRDEGGCREMRKDNEDKYWNKFEETVKEQTRFKSLVQLYI